LSSKYGLEDIKMKKLLPILLILQIFHIISFAQENSSEAEGKMRALSCKSWLGTYQANAHGPRIANYRKALQAAEILIKYECSNTIGSLDSLRRTIPELKAKIDDLQKASESNIFSQTTQTGGASNAGTSSTSGGGGTSNAGTGSTGSDCNDGIERGGTGFDCHQFVTSGHTVSDSVLRATYWDEICNPGDYCSQWGSTSLTGVLWRGVMKKSKTATDKPYVWTIGFKNTSNAVVVAYPELVYADGTTQPGQGGVALTPGSESVWHVTWGTTSATPPTLRFYKYAICTNISRTSDGYKCN